MGNTFQNFKTKNLCFLAIGNEMRGDDGVGIFIGKKIPKRKNIRVFLCYTVPENFALKVHEKETVFLIDAVLNTDEDYIITDSILNTKTISNHSPSLKLTYDLVKSITPDVYLIGIKIQQNEFGKEISKITKKRAEKLMKEMDVLWK